MRSARQRLDVDAWFELAERDPEAFEAMRLRMIEDVVESAPSRLKQRLLSLQWRIDQERRLANTPLAACIRMSRMMWERVTGPKGLLDSIDRLSEVITEPDMPSPSPPPLPGRVILFPRRQSEE